jgi:UrcA family protein
MSIRTALLIPALFAVAANAANAAEPVGAFEPTSVEVRFDDLNLATAAGRAKLERRVSSAVVRACPIRGSQDLAIVANAMRCRQAARQAAKPQVQLALQQSGTQQLAVIDTHPHS